MSTPVFNQAPTVQYRPYSFKDAQGQIIQDSTTHDYLAFQGDNGDGTTLIYKGYARPGTATSATGWQISKWAYDDNSPPNVTSVTWPENIQGNASADFNFIWESRADYTYA